MTAITRDKPFVCDNPHDAHVWTKHEHEQQEVWEGLKEQEREAWEQRWADNDSALQDALSPPPRPRVESAPFTATPAPVVEDSASDKSGSRKVWTTEKLEELQAYRQAHTMPETAAKFGISEQRIRQLLPSDKPKASPFPGVIHRLK